MTDPVPDIDPDKSKPSPARIAIWVVVGGIGLYMLLSGLIGALT